MVYQSDLEEFFVIKAVFEAALLTLLFLFRIFSFRGLAFLDLATGNFVAVCVVQLEPLADDAVFALERQRVVLAL